MYDPKIHHRRSIRLKNYDYAGKGLYFITLCTAQRKNLFGEIINGELFLNPLGEIAKEEWAKTPEIRNNTSLGAFIIMPNHMHGIISIDYQIRKPRKDEIGKFHSPSHTIGAIIRGYKGATTRRIHQLIREIKEGGGAGDRTGKLQFAPTALLSGESSIWHRNYYEKIIRNEKAYRNISNYIINNPANWKKDKLK
ncbi:hypothetical protein PbJCM13498_30250 [Prolixibacter bellariivorans]|uniref:Transposase IS200-like domain-containing protein n=1 Tax=Prolixibacter bellariivorans TaxID=314319 RepID=A0A5M4B214_9BACT|nr:transposase [Prolixibacter bellariivorans]GET34162.1 hypothetical protein PbJCM13498_30250 [Prolixibacter bellariivorans]